MRSNKSIRSLHLYLNKEKTNGRHIDFMREFDVDIDYGFTVSKKPFDDTLTIDLKVVEDSNLEIAKVKADVGDIKSMMNEIMQIVAEKDSVNKEIQDNDVSARFKEIEKTILLFV